MSMLTFGMLGKGIAHQTATAGEPGEVAIECEVRLQAQPFPRGPDENPSALLLQTFHRLEAFMETEAFRAQLEHPECAVVQSSASADASVSEVSGRLHGYKIEPRVQKTHANAQQMSEAMSIPIT